MNCVCLRDLPAGQERVSTHLVASFLGIALLLGKKNFQRVDFQGILGIWERRKDHFGAATVPVAGDRVFPGLLTWLIQFSLLGC